MRKVIAGAVAFWLFQAGRLFARATRVLNHLAAGTLTIDELRAGVDRTWGAFGARDADIAAGLTRWEDEMVARFIRRDDDVLLVGSGPGRDLVALVSRGYRVTGVEPAPRAVAACRRHLEARGLSAGIIEGFFEDVALPCRFDVVVFAGCCYNFIPGSRRRIAALRKAADALEPHGRILVNYMNEPAGHPALIRLARIAAAASGSDWQPEPGDVILPADSARPLFHYEHRFTDQGLEAEAGAAGLRVAHRCEFPNAPVVVLEAAGAGGSSQVPHGTG